MAGELLLDEAVDVDRPDRLLSGVSGLAESASFVRDLEACKGLVQVFFSPEVGRASKRMWWLMRLLIFLKWVAMKRNL